MMENENSIKIEIVNLDHLIELSGNLDENIKIIETKFEVKIVLRSGNLVVIGDEENRELASKLINELLGLIATGEQLDKHKVMYSIGMALEGAEGKMKELLDEIICVTNRGAYVKPKTHGQKEYIKTIGEKDVTFGVGPAGTGKTYLAVAMAIKAFKNNEVNRIIITRPAVEAGESLGYLPGDLQNKITPYLRPLHDALNEILGAETYLKYKDRGLIEIAPLAYMRGRTLDNAFIILDEAQNTTGAQMRMFLTRFGFGSKVVINGDISQMDLQKGKKSGLQTALEVLSSVDDIGFIHFSERDVVRHGLVQKIILEYDKHDRKTEDKKRR